MTVHVLVREMGGGMSADDSRNARLAALYDAHAGELVRFTFLLTGDRELASDIVHDAFIRAAARWQHLRRPDALELYLRRSISNLVKNHWRRRATERDALPKLAATVPVTEDTGEHDRVIAALLRIPLRQRTALALRYYADLSEGEAAAVLGCSIDAVKALRTRGLRNLAAELGEGE
jgi:RNA polymerase sigma factor (sigma-70 family)